MKIKILPSARQDLVDGYWFYEKQSSILDEGEAEVITLGQEIKKSVTL